MELLSLDFDDNLRSGWLRQAFICNSTGALIRRVERDASEVRGLLYDSQGGFSSIGPGYSVENRIRAYDSAVVLVASFSYPSQSWMGAVNAMTVDSTTDTLLAATSRYDGMHWLCARHDTATGEVTKNFRVADPHFQPLVVEALVDASGNGNGRVAA